MNYKAKIEGKGGEKKLREKLKKEKGITLIALIITIIILVILAAVSIRAVYSMGIVGRAINGTQDYARAAKAENEMFKSVEALLESTLGKLNGTEIGEENNDKEEELLEEYIIEQGKLNEEYIIDGWGSDTSGGKPVFGYGDEPDTYYIAAAWGNGRAGMYFEPKLDFSNILKIEADVLLWSNMEGLTNTTTLGVQLDEITKNGAFDISETIVDKTSSVTEHNIVCDTRDISGEGYIKFYLEHGPESGAMTVAMGVKKLKIYYNTNIPKFNVKLEEINDDVSRVSISNIEYKDNLNNWQVKYKRSEEDSWHTSNNLSFIVNHGIYNIKIVSGNIESKQKKLVIGKKTIDYTTKELYVENIKTSSNQDATRTGDKTFDNSTDAVNNCWHSTQGVSNQWIEIDLKSKTKITDFTLQNRSYDSTATAIKDFDLQVSDDSENWTTIESYTNLSSDADYKQTYTVDYEYQNDGYKYYRILAKTGYGSYVAIGEMTYSFF